MVEMLRMKGMIIVLVVEYNNFFVVSICLVNVSRSSATIFKIGFGVPLSSDKSVVMLEILRTITDSYGGQQQAFLFDKNLYFIFILSMKYISLGNPPTRNIHSL